MSRVYLPFFRGWLSQWHHSNFTDPELPSPCDKHVFTSAESYMMLRKALLFDDEEIASKILVEHNCRKVKALGRRVRGFDQKKWEANREEIVTRGNYLKFTQDANLKKKFIATHPRIFVEASPYDRIWGVGISEANPNIQNPKFWKGKNLLGECLTKAREQIIQDE